MAEHMTIFQIHPRETRDKSYPRKTMVALKFEMLEILTRATQYNVILSYRRKSKLSWEDHDLRN